jgi:plasmid stabilization system protein ParE
MRTLRVLPEAEEEIAHTAEWYESKRPGLGVEMVAVIEAAFEQIVDAPLACAVWRRGRPYREKIVERFPYIIFFTIDDAVVEVVAVAHTKRKPGYWLERR